MTSLRPKVILITSRLEKLPGFAQTIMASSVSWSWFLYTVFPFQLCGAPPPFRCIVYDSRFHDSQYLKYLNPKKLDLGQLGIDKPWILQFARAPDSFRSDRFDRLASYAPDAMPLRAAESVTDGQLVVSGILIIGRHESALCGDLRYVAGTNRQRPWLNVTRACVGLANRANLYVIRVEDSHKREGTGIWLNGLMVKLYYCRC